MPKPFTGKCKLTCLAYGFTHYKFKISKGIYHISESTVFKTEPFGSAVIGHLESFPSAREFNKMIEELSTVRTNLQHLGRGGGVAEGNVQVCPILAT